MIGCHDYEVFEKMTGSQIKTELKRRTDPKARRKRMTQDTNYYKKVCIDCGKITDTITPTRAWMEQLMIEKEQRRARVEKVLDQISYKQRNRTAVTVRYNSHQAPVKCWTCKGSLYKDDLGIYKCKECGQQHEGF